MKSYRLVLALTSLLFLSGCARMAQNAQLTTINLVDRNGFSETISARERLNRFEKVDFTASQPYEKVLRVFKRQDEESRSILTSYHPNGEIRQYLEAVNGRAKGSYKEWYADGVLKLQARVIGGNADLTEGAQSSWLFDGCSQVYDESGHLIAEIPYEKGLLQGTARYYTETGELWKSIPYENNQVQGALELFCGKTLVQRIQFVEGVRHGESLHYWLGDGRALAARELFDKGRLQEGEYFDCEGQPLSSILHGYGVRTVFGTGGPCEFQEYQDGMAEGKVSVIGPKGALVATYHVKQGVKHGPEVQYFLGKRGLAENGRPSPKLEIAWFEGAVQGTCRTWYDNGLLESQREMSQNKKHGLSTAWYRDGTLMMVEEYKGDRLVDGEYYQRGEKLPLTRVVAGKGTATLFNGEGHFVQQIEYEEGVPHG